MSILVEKLNRRIAQTGSLLCVGLDPHEQFASSFPSLFAFNQFMIEQTHPYAIAYKINTAFYESQGVQGWKDLEQTIVYLRTHFPEVVTIADAKRGDTQNTNRHYAKAFFDILGFDAVTLHPYLGRESLLPFLERKEKGCIILCRTSNPGAGEVQDVHVEGATLWERIAQKVAQEWNTNDNCMLVVGATYPNELQRVRQLVGRMPILSPGVGAQGGEVAPTVQMGVDEQGRGLLLSVSRALYVPQPASVAHEITQNIKGALAKMRR